MPSGDKHRGIENPEYHKAMLELRRSNASGTHADKRERRARSRADKQRKAIEQERNAEGENT